MNGHIEVQNSASAVVDHEETVEQLEGDRGHGEEVHRGDSFAVVPQEGLPPLSSIARARSPPSEVAKDSAFGDLEAQLQWLTVDFRRAPRGILQRHSFNCFENFSIDFAPAEVGHTRTESPVQSKSSAVPADYRLGLDEDEGLGPAVPDGGQCHPEQAVPPLDMRPRIFTFEHGDLLAESEDLQSEVVVRTDEGTQVRPEAQTKVGA